MGAPYGAEAHKGVLVQHINAYMIWVQTDASQVGF